MLRVPCYIYSFWAPNPIPIIKAPFLDASQSHPINRRARHFYGAELPLQTGLPQCGLPANAPKGLENQRDVAPA